MNYQDYIPEALEIVSAWEIQSQDFAQVVNDQAKIMAGLDPGLLADTSLDNPHSSLPF